MHDDLAATFRTYAVTAAGDEAPTHRLLAHAVAAEPAVLAVVAAAPPDRRHPNNLFAAVRFLLLGGLDHRLGEHYGALGHHSASADPATPTSVGSGPPSPEDLGPAFVDLVSRHRGEVIAAMTARPIQTNEHARSAHIAAGLALVQRRHGPVGLVDVGSSAGLNLMVDRCRIDYGSHVVGPPDTAPLLRCELLGAAPPRAPEGLAIGWRCGLDREPVDLDDEASRRWLRACVWIDHLARRDRLDAAIAAARADPPPIIAGDAVDDLAELLDRVPEDLHVVVVTTWVAYYLSDDQRRAVRSVMADAGRPVSWLSLELPGVVEGIDRPRDTPSSDIVPSVLALITWGRDGTAAQEFLGWAQHHGTWLDWRGPHN